MQLINRVTWDNIIKPPDPAALGWKETIRVSSLEDTYVASRPILPVLRFDFPNRIRSLSPMMPKGAWLANDTLAELLGLPLLGFAPNGGPINIVNRYVNYGAEYMYHCHILSHEEMDMMHAVSLTIKPVKPDGLAFDPNTQTLSWIDNSLSEPAFVVEKSSDGVDWTQIATIPSPVLPTFLNQIDPQQPTTIPENVQGVQLTYVVQTCAVGEKYRGVAQNTVGDTWDYSDANLNEVPSGTFAFPVFTVASASDVLDTFVPPPQPPAAPSDLTAAQTGAWQVSLAWVDNANNEAGFVIERSTDGVNFFVLAALPPDATSNRDLAVSGGFTYTYRVAAVNWFVMSDYSNAVSIFVSDFTTPSAAPSGLFVTNLGWTSLTLNWTDNSNHETGFTIQRALNSSFTKDLATFTIARGDILQ